MLWRERRWSKENWTNKKTIIHFCQWWKLNFELSLGVMLFFLWGMIAAFLDPLCPMNNEWDEDSDPFNIAYAFKWFVFYIIYLFYEVSADYEWIRLYTEGWYCIWQHTRLFFPEIAWGGLLCSYCLVECVYAVLNS